MIQEKNDSKEIKTKKWIITRDELAEFLLTAVANGEMTAEIIFNNETVRLTQKRWQNSLDNVLLSQSI